MAKELPFFKFEPAEWIFGRIQRQSDAVKVAFMDLMCKYWHNVGFMTLEDAELDFGNDEVHALISKKIIKIDPDQMVRIKFLDQQLEQIEKISNKNSKNGKKSAALRAERKINDRSTTVEENEATVQRSSTDKKRQDETIQEKNVFYSDEDREKLINDLKNSTQWKVSIVRSIKHSTKKEIPVEDLDGWIVVFVDHLIATNEVDKAWKMIQAHFKNWLLHQLEKHPNALKKGKFEIANDSATDIKKKLKDLRGE